MRIQSIEKKSIAMIGKLFWVGSYLSQYDVLGINKSSNQSSASEASRLCVEELLRKSAHIQDLEVSFSSDASHVGILILVEHLAQ